MKNYDAIVRILMIGVVFAIVWRAFRPSKPIEPGKPKKAGKVLGALGKGIMALVVLWIIFMAVIFWMAGQRTVV